MPSPIVTSLEQLKESVLSSIKNDLQSLIRRHEDLVNSKFKVNQPNEWMHQICIKTYEALTCDEDNLIKDELDWIIHTYEKEIIIDNETKRLCNTDRACLKKYHCWRWMAQGIYAGPKECTDLWKECGNSDTFLVNFVEERTGISVDSFDLDDLMGKKKENVMDIVNDILGGL